MPDRIGDLGNVVLTTTTPIETHIDVNPAAGPTGLDRAVNEHDVASGAGALNTNTNTSGLSGAHPMIALLGVDQLLSSNRPSAFALIAGRYPDAIGLDVVLSQLGNQEHVKSAVRQMIADFTLKTGVQVPQALINAAIANPAKLADVLALTPKQLSQSADAIAAAHRTGAIKDAAPKQYILPQEFELAKLDAVAYERPKESLKQLVPGLYQGDLKSELPDAQAKANTVLAEIFDRLAENPSKDAKDRFSVKFAGREYRSLQAFVDGLERAGHTVEISFNQRIANFADLKTKIGDRWFDVPAGLLVKSTDQRGREVALPAAHAEMIISVKGPAITANTKFFQGMTSTGFFPCDIWQTPNWLGSKIAPEKFSGRRSIEAVTLAGHLSDTINAVAKELKLPFAGYGALGVCMDSVAVLRHAMTGLNDYWPLLMRDSLLSPQIEKRLGDLKRSDDDELARLWNSMRAVPSDADLDPPAHARMLSSIPWDEGREPFERTALVRRMLMQRE